MPTPERRLGRARKAFVRVWAVMVLLAVATAIWPFSSLFFAYDVMGVVTLLVTIDLIECRREVRPKVSPVS